METAYVTSKGQLVIPAKIRRKLGIKPGTKICFVEREHEVLELVAQGLDNVRIAAGVRARSGLVRSVLRTPAGAVMASLASKVTIGPNSSSRMSSERGSLATTTLRSSTPSSTSSRRGSPVLPPFLRNAAMTGSFIRFQPAAAKDLPQMVGLLGQLFEQEPAIEPSIERVRELQSAYDTHPPEDG